MTIQVRKEITSFLIGILMIFSLKNGHSQHKQNPATMNETFPYLKKIQTFSLIIERRGIAEAKKFSYNL